MTAFRLLPATMLTVSLFVLAAGADDTVPSKALTTSSLQGTMTWEALHRTIELDARSTPLTEVIDDVARQAGVEIVVHPQAFASVAVEESEPIDLSLHGVCAHSALKVLLEPHNLQFSVRVDGRVIIDSEQTRSALTIRKYEVGDLVEDALKPATDDASTQTLKNLRNLIVTTVQPNSWDEFGGSGSLSVDSERHSLVVRQTALGHAEVTLLLEQLRKHHHGRVPMPESMRPSEEVHDQIREKLETTRISVSHSDVALSKVLSDICVQSHVNLLLDARGLAEEGLRPDVPVSLNVRDKLAAEALGRLLASLHLEYIIEDAVVKVTSRMRALGDLTVRVYRVGPGSNAKSDEGQRVTSQQLDELARQVQLEKEREKLDTL